ncbi:ABC transporter permease [Nocardioides daphniae]|uniref:ABC transporter n=1 Tax=Nocardioides daphniae TaxID=402297 RepID=A0A4P7UCS8_9ACTN|nr:ABC transporter permease [Nocardioides daphniae]QCC77856.1 ABC transporter [Nocardioides daphniae]GGD27698.1 transport permease protein [Nocardioides daphniae]
MSQAPSMRGEELPPLAPPAANSGLLEVFRKRYLLGMLVRNTIKSRYQGTALGWTWSYLQPGVRFAMFYFVFQVAIGRGGDDLPNFAIHLFAGMILVHFFTETFNGGTAALVRARGLISKLAMPKELFPVSRMLVALWHTGPMLVILLVACVFLGWTPDLVGVAAGLLAFGILIPLGLALALFFSVLNVFMRDFGKVVGTLTQFTTFSVPMIYPYTMVHERFGDLGSQIYLLNPVAEAVLLLQRCFWVGTGPDPQYLIDNHFPDDLWARGGIMMGASLLLLVLAQLWFSKYEKRVAERL